MPDEEKQDDIVVHPKKVVVEEEEQKEETEGQISCSLEDFEAKICSPDKTAVLFLGRETENVDEIMKTVVESQDLLGMNIGVLDMNDDKCGDLSEKYKIDRDATQLVIFESCEKKGAINLETDPEEQIKKLKDLVSKPDEEEHEQEAE